MNLNDIIINTMISFIGFISGFILGTIVDVCIFKTYEKIDKCHTQDHKLVIMVLLQIFIILLLTEMLPSHPVIKYSTSLGLMSSQIFLLQYAVKRVSNVFCDRSCKNN